MFKKILIYALCLAPWFLNNLIPYDYNSTYYDIINSGLNEDDKNKIQRWSGFTR